MILLRFHSNLCLHHHLENEGEGLTNVDERCKRQIHQAMVQQAMNVNAVQFSKMTIGNGYRRWIVLFALRPTGIGVSLRQQAT